MQRRYLWCAVVFAAVPALVFACGGRSDIDLLLDAAAGAAGVAGASGKGGAAGAGAAGVAGAAGQGGPKAGAAGNALCTAGQQVSCACPGTDLGGVQICKSDGSGFSPCTGCPSPAGPGGSGGASVGGSGGASAGGAGQGGAPQGGSAGQGPGGGEPPDGGDFFDALPFPLPDSGPVGECVACLQDKCSGAINGCYNNPDCTAGIQCAITDCVAGNALGGGQQGAMGGNPFGGGGLDFGCLLGCFNGDPTAVFAAVQAFQCITQTCGDDCGGGVLGDGGFPLGGLGGGPSPAGGGPSNLTLQGVRVPSPAEVPGFPRMQQALTPRR